jgi:hypothetical protein
MAGALEFTPERQSREDGTLGLYFELGEDIIPLLPTYPTEATKPELNWRSSVTFQVSTTGKRMVFSRSRKVISVTPLHHFHEHRWLPVQERARGAPAVGEVEDRIIDQVTASGGRIDGLAGENRQVLRNARPNGAKDTDVKRAAIPH